MPIVSEKNKVLENIVQVVKTFKVEEQKDILKRLQIEAYLKQSNKPIAMYDKTKIKAPTMKETDNWKHKALATK
jgi:hypothetical protein